MSESLRADEPVFEDDGGFHDYTIATALEKLIASIENALRHVLTKDLPRRHEISSGSASGSHMPATYTAHLHHRLPFRSETYSLSLHIPSTNTTPCSQPSIALISLGDQPNKLQEWFLPGPCICLCPDSYSGRILDEDEAHTLLSAGAAALSHLKLPWPVYIPVHDALRDAYRGIAIGNWISGSNGEGTIYNGSLNRSSTNSTSVRDNNNGAVVRFESDSIHSRNLPLEFCTLSGQLNLFSSRLRWHAPHAASLCSDLATLAADSLLETSNQDYRMGGRFLQREHEEEEDEDQNLAAAAEALALSSSPISSPSKQLFQQRRPSAASTSPINDNKTSTLDESNSSEELSVVWEIRRSYELPLLNNNNNNYRPHSAGGASATASGWETSSTQSSSQVAAPLGNTPIRHVDTSIDDEDDDDDFELRIDTWDDEAVWRPWAAEDDPIERLEIDALWNIPLNRTESQSSLDTTGSNITSASGNSSTTTSIINSNVGLVEAAVAIEQGGGGLNLKSPPPPPVDSAAIWRLAALRRDYQPDDGRRPLILLQSVDQRRQFLRLQSVTELPLIPNLETTTPASFSTSSSFSSFQPPADALPGATSFSGMLNALLNYTPFIINATDASHLVSDEWWLNQGNYVPPLTPSYVIQDAIRDIFQALSRPPTWPGTGTGLLSEQLRTLEDFHERNEQEEGQEIEKIVAAAAMVVGKGAPLNSLISRLALHALRLGNPRAVAMLWTKFLRELRFAHWEARVPLPRMATTTITTQKQPPQEITAATAPSPILDNANEFGSKYCVLHQKLQLLDVCIRSKLEAQQQSEKEQGEVQETEKLIEKSEDDEEGYTSATEHSSATSTTTHTAHTTVGSSTLEGEKSLHFLETLPPAAVHAELLAVGFTSAIAILSRAPAAKLPAVAAQLERVKELGNAWLGDHGVAVASNNSIQAGEAGGLVSEAAAAAAEGSSIAIITPSASESNLSDMTTSETDDNTQYHQQNQPGGGISNLSISPAVHAMIHSGLAPEGMSTLVQILACVEQTIAAGQSLLQRLSKHNYADSSNEDFAKKAANALIFKALEHGSGTTTVTIGSTSSTHSESTIYTGYGTIIELNAAEFIHLTGMDVGNQQDYHGEERKNNSSTTSKQPTPFWNEWSICISKGNKSALNPLHRLFVRQLSAELRVATVITSEMS